MNELIYTYERGKGWIIQYIESLTFTHANGKRFRIERRVPQPGETYVRWGTGPLQDIVTHCNRFHNWHTGINKHNECLAINTPEDYVTVVDA